MSRRNRQSLHPFLSTEDLCCRVACERKVGEIMFMVPNVRECLRVVSCKSVRAGKNLPK